MMRSQFQLNLVNSEIETRQIRKIMLEAATMFNLVDNTAESKVPNTVLSLVERKGFGLGARISGQLLIVDFNLRGGDLVKFEMVKTYLIAELNMSFSERINLVTEENASYVKI